MHPTRTLLLPLALFGLLGFVSGCGDGDESGTGGAAATSGATTSTSGAGGGASSSTSGSGGGGSQTVELAFEARVGDTPFSCAGSFPGLGLSGADADITDFRFYAHDFELHDSASGSWVPMTLVEDGLYQVANLALLDFEDKTGNCGNGTAETNTVVRGVVPLGTYDGARFKLGVPFALNHADVATAPSPLNLSGLFWNWQGGYKFLRVDSVPVGGGSPFNVHIGSTGCDGDPSSGGVTSCDRENVTAVELADFDPATGVIVADYAALVADNDLGTDGGGAPGCMAGVTDPECGPIFSHLGLDITDGSESPETLDFFHAE